MIFFYRFCCLFIFIKFFWNFFKKWSFFICIFKYYFVLNSNKFLIYLEHKFVAFSLFFVLYFVSNFYKYQIYFVIKNLNLGCAGYIASSGKYNDFDTEFVLFISLILIFGSVNPSHPTLI